MKTPRSPVFVEDDDDVLKPGERWASDKVLGSGNHASAELKLAFLRLFQMFEDRELVLRPSNRKKAPYGNVAKVAMALGVANDTVQQAVNEKNRTGKVADPDPRGPPPADWDDYAPMEGYALRC